MELQTTTRRIGLTETIYDDFDERPLDCDFMLPDFLPDIAAILKCRVKPVVQTHQISGDRVMADGLVSLQVLYLDEERRCVHSFENTQPFTSTFTVKELQNGDTVQFAVRVNYVNCRATGPRRLDIHGAFGVKLTVTGCREQTVLDAVDCDAVHTRCCTVHTTTPASCAEKTFTQTELLELGGGAAQTVLRNDASVCISECKQLPDKAVIKGDLLIETVCLTDPSSGAVHKTVNRIPFSQLLDVDGLTEQSLCDCHARVLACDARLTQNPNGESCLLSVTVKTALQLQCLQTEQHEVICDAFHTAYPLLPETAHICPTCVTALVCDTVTVRPSLTLPDTNAGEVLDVWSDLLSLAQNEQEDGLCGQLSVGLLARGSDGTVTYYEQPCDLCLPQSELTGAIHVTASVLGTTATVTGDRLDLQVTLSLCCRVGTTEPHTVLCALQADDTAPFAGADGMDGCQVKVCFGEAGESVWELAKAHHASPAALKAENHLTEDCLPERTLLLIPLC